MFEDCRLWWSNFWNKVTDESVKEKMRQAVNDVQSGKFAEKWIKESEGDKKRLNILVTEMRSIRSRSWFVHQEDYGNRKIIFLFLFFFFLE